MSNTWNQGKSGFKSLISCFYETPPHYGQCDSSCVTWGHLMWLLVVLQSEALPSPESLCSQRRREKPGGRVQKLPEE